MSSTRPEFFKSQPITLILMAIVLIVVGSIVTSMDYKEKKHYDDLLEEGNFTYGYVTDVHRRHTTRRSRKHYRSSTYYMVSGKYKIDNKYYDFIFKSYSDWEEGSGVKIFYDEANPGNYVVEGDEVEGFMSSVMILLAGVVFGAAGIKKQYDKKAREARLYSTGSY